jgi:hypothetical protein
VRKEEITILRRCALRRFFLILTLLSCLIGVLLTKLSAQEAPQNEAEKSLNPVLIGLFIGYHGSFVEGIKDLYGSSGGLSAGAELSYAIKDELRAAARYEWFSLSATGLPDWTENIVNIGLRYSWFGAGVSWISVQGSSGTGFYAEVVTVKNGFYLGLKADFVSINSAKVGGYCVYLGYGANF